jgi:hypothetical protein
MAYNSKFVSLETVIEKAYQDSGVDNIDWDAAISWTADLMGIIGVPGTYIKKSTNGLEGNPDFVEISNYRGELPTDVLILEGCRKVKLDSDNEVTQVYPMIETQELFIHTPTPYTASTGAIVSDPYFQTAVLDENGEIQQVELTQEQNYPYSTILYTYKVNGNTIFTNFEEGFIEMEYKGMLLDERGLPMIPGDPKYIRAIANEIIWKIDYLKWRQNPSPQNASIKNDSARERDWAVAAAISKHHIPTIDEIESIKNTWLRSIQDVNAHNTSFISNNAPEVRYNHNSRVWRRR